MLFEAGATKPLADVLRPTELTAVFGQDPATGEGQFLRTLIDEGRAVSLLLWGPPGVGKTTIARIIAGNSGAHFVELSAVTSGVGDIKKVIDQAHAQRSLGKNLVLFVDEIHRFNKAQQDSLLPHIENGTIIFIGATTENPSFEVNAPLLSRLRVVTLEILDENALDKIVSRGLEHLQKHTLHPSARKALIHLSQGDARAALNGLEVAASLSKTKQITQKSIEAAMQKSVPSYDKKGEGHYNTISAYIKSMRAGAVDAALFYLQRMLAAGEDPKFIARRLIIFASEDIGMAGSHALTLAVAGFQSVERVGMPESNYVLSHLTIALSTSRKSRAVADAMYAAKKAVTENPKAQPPLHLRNAPTKLMRDLGYQKDYEWQAGFFHKDGYMPKGLEAGRFYTPPGRDIK